MIIIGEKINGAIPSVAKAIAERNEAFIVDLAVRQTEAGADYLDLCAGTAVDLEYDALAWLIGVVQDTVDTPICIDSPDAEMIKSVLPLIKREGLINSVSEENGKSDNIYPLVARSGWKLIALTCDDKGIPSSTDKKVEIAGVLIDKAKFYGISEDRIFIDPLVLALSAVNDALLSFTETLSRVRAKYANVKFTSGLSNISFGMPNRKLINRNFLAYAIEAGMDSAIMDPTNKDIYSTILASEVLLGKDKYCKNYNRAYRKGRLA